MSESEATESKTQSVCTRCGARLASTVGWKEVCFNCLLSSALDQEDIDLDSALRRSDDELPVQFGDYELLEEVGRGGQGVVYRAHQKGLNRTVALKVISLGQWASKAHVKRFRREAEAAASLDHPSIVPIHEVGERDGSCYFSMQFIEGGQLDEVVRSAPMSIRQAAELIAKVARTVHYAHEHGILHRDIKPGNILLDQRGEPHLTDFGLARLLESQSTVTGTLEILGTPSYMAPEQAAGKNTKLSSATDVYGLGAVLYQLLTGHPPFAGGTTYETIKLLLDTEPRPPRSLNPKIDRELSTICLKCLEKDPQRRYPSALALAEDLEHWLKHEPIQAKPTGFFTHGRKWVSPFGQGLWLSVLLRSQLPFDQCPLLVQMGAIAAAAAVERWSEHPVYIKPPNDLVVGGGKLGGFLLETSNTWDFQVLGMGINVRSAPQIEGYPTAALDQFSKHPIPMAILASDLLSRFEDWYLRTPLEFVTPAFTARIPNG